VVYIFYLKDKNWDEIWKNFKGLNWFGRRLKNKERKVLKKILEEIKLLKSAKIIDGCGTGFTLAFLREFGYSNSIEIDLSKNSLAICNELFNFKSGKDVFLIDAKHINFPDNSFDFVFSDGLLEHFEDFTTIAKEFSRVSKSWILLFQPDPTSLFGRLKRFAENFIHFSWEKENFYRKEEYVKVFSRSVNSEGINFNKQMWLLLKKVKI